MGEKVEITRKPGRIEPIIHPTVALRLASLDWYPGFNYTHIYVRLLARSLSCRIQDSTPEDADLVLVGPYGRRKEEFQKRRGQIVIYGSGENTRPDYRFCDLSLTLDHCTYGGLNVRIPAWAGEFDFWGDAPLATYKRAETEQLLSTNHPLSVMKITGGQNKIAAIFSTYEQNRISILQALEEHIGTVTKIGKLWGEAEICRDASALFPAKHPVLVKHLMNLCFENSIAPGYITEKILHARMAGCVALTYAHPTCNNDYDSKGLLNYHDYLSIDAYVNQVKEILCSEDCLKTMREAPVFESKPNPEDLVTQTRQALMQFLRSWV